MNALGEKRSWCARLYSSTGVDLPSNPKAEEVLEDNPIDKEFTHVRQPVDHELLPFDSEKVVQ